MRLKLWNKPRDILYQWAVAISTIIQNNLSCLKFMRMINFRFLLFVIGIVLLSSCSQPSLDDELLEAAPGAYSITYNREFGLFIINRKQKTDTVSLWDNWLYPLYRYRQQQKDISSGTSYDEFLKSN